MFDELILYFKASKSRTKSANLVAKKQFQGQKHVFLVHFSISLMSLPSMSETILVNIPRIWEKSAGSNSHLLSQISGASK